jgi:hypothetical protein
VSKDGAMNRYNFLQSPLSWRQWAWTVALVLAGSLFGAAAATAQDTGAIDWNHASDPLQGGIGLHYGQLGGHGLAFRAPIRWWLYFQVAGGVWHTEDKQQHNLGFNLNYILRQDQRTRIYINAGTGFFYSKEVVGTGAGGEEITDLEENWNLGGGVGLEYLQGKRWAWKIEANFAHLGKSGDIKVIPQAGVSYYW